MTRFFCWGQIRQRGFVDRLKTPPTFTAVHHRIPVRVRSDLRIRSRGLARIGRTHANPLLKIRNDRRLEFGAGLWHFEVILMPNGFDQQAGVWVARNNGRARIATVQQGLPGIQRQAALLLAAGAMTLVAILRQHRADIGFEKLHRAG